MADTGKSGPLDQWLQGAGQFLTSLTKLDSGVGAKNASQFKPSNYGAGTAGSSVKSINNSTFTPSNYGAGTAGAVIGARKAGAPLANPVTPANSQIIKNLGGTTGGSTGGAKRFSVDDLYLDPTPQFQPLLDLYNKQQKDLTDRYAANAADIKNIFGNLTTVRAQDKAKIAQQYKTSIEQQQAALAERTAEARQGVAASQQGAATAAAEMGTAGQPAPTDSLTSQAAEQGIADSYAYQTTWDKLQNVMSLQAQNDVQNAIQGYDYQQTSALETLRNNLEDRLAAIQANMAGTQSDIAGAQLAGKQNVLNAKYSEQQAKDAAAVKLQQAAISAANKKTTYPKTVTGWQQKVNDLGFIPNDIASSIQYAKTLANRALNANLKPGEKSRSATKPQIWDYWMKNNGGADETAVALEYLNLLPK